MRSRATALSKPGASALKRGGGGRQRQRPMRPLLRIATIIIACSFCALPSAADPLPPTVLVLHRSIPYTEHFGKLFASFQSTLKAGSDTPITTYSEGLGYSHFK